MTMALKDTINTMKKIISCIGEDLDKSCNGNRAAAQRARTNSIKFAKCAKIYRKESIAAEKKERGKGKKSVKAKKTVSKRKN